MSLREIQKSVGNNRDHCILSSSILPRPSTLLSRMGLFLLLQKIGCPPKLLTIITSFHENIKDTVCYDGSISEAFPIRSGVKQGCVLAPTLFGISISLLLSHKFDGSSEGVYLHTRSDDKLFNLARLKAKTNVRKILVREMLLADDAALATHTHTGSSPVACGRDCHSRVGLFSHNRKCACVV